MYWQNVKALGHLLWRQKAAFSIHLSTQQVNGVNQCIYGHKQNKLQNVVEF